MNCKQCNQPMEVKKLGAPKKYCSPLCKERARYARTGSRPRPSGYYKARYRADREYQKARALKYYYENRDKILEQKRDSPGKKEPVENAVALIRLGKATLDDAHDWMNQNLGFFSFEVESFISDMIEDE